MNSGWMILGLGIAVVILLLVTSWLRRREVADLGSVSNQWIAEQRLGQGHDSQR